MEVIHTKLPKNLEVDERGFSPLHFEPIENRFEWGRQLYILTEDLWFYHRFGQDEVIYFVEKGYVTDFASVPWPFSYWFPPGCERWREPAVFHDDACDRAARGEFPRQVADARFYMLAWCCGATAFEREMMYVGIRMYGLTAYQIRCRRKQFRTRFGKKIYNDPVIGQIVAHYMAG